MQDPDKVQNLILNWRHQLLPEALDKEGEDDHQTNETIARGRSSYETEDSTSIIRRYGRIYEPYSNDQQLRKVRDAQRGDKKAERDLVLHNYRLYINCANRFYRPDQFEDLVQVGAKTLIIAIRLFDFRKSTRFSTFAMILIMRAMRRFMDQLAEKITLPVHVRERIRDLQRIAKVLREELNRDPSVHEIALRAGLNDESVDKLLDFAFMQVGIFSLDRLISSEADDAGDTMHSIVEDRKSGVAAQFDVDEMHEFIIKVLDNLTTDEHDLIVWRFGLNGAEPLTYQQIADRLNRDKSTIHRRFRGLIKRINSQLPPGSRSSIKWASHST